jgi:hypothetical protein
MSDPTHRRFVVRVTHPHEQAPADRLWRVNHADETLRTVTLAYFTRGEGGQPACDGGKYEVHAPSRDTLDTTREILTKHEGLTIVSEDEAPGTGWLIRRPR